MNLKLYILVIVGVFSILPPSTASALLITTDPGNPDGYMPGTLLYDFETGFAPSSLTGDFTVYSIPSGLPQSAAPAFDISNYYLSIPNPKSGGTASLSFSTDMSYLGFYWGSIDSYNRVDFFNNGIATGDFVTGSMVANPANGNQTLAQTNRYVNLTSLAAFDEVRFNSTNYAFEIDNIAAGSVPVPEPATMLMFGTGLVGLVGLSSRRKKK